MWTISRFVTGISLVSCYVVSESWLNDRATNRIEATLSAYDSSLFRIINWMLLLNVSEPKRMSLLSWYLSYYLWL